MESNQPPLKSLSGVNPEKLAALATRTIYFGHKSVGDNIIAGIEDLMAESSSIKLKVVEIDRITEIDQPMFAHSKLGENAFPRTKMDQFRTLFTTTPVKNVDIAFLKYCFVDISFNSNVDAELDYYLNAMQQLQTANPDTQLVYLTVPLTILPTKFVPSIKNLIKGILGKPRYGVDDNLKKYEYNQKLRERLPAGAKLFDIARFESTYADGSRSLHKKGGKVFESVITAYTYDEGHLNTTGRKFIAEQLLIFLAEL